MRLQRLIQEVEFDSSPVSVVHGVMEITCGGEFTICGRAIPDSVLEFEGWQREGDEYSGRIKDCECKECRRIIEYYKRLR